MAVVRATRDRLRLPQPPNLEFSMRRPILLAAVLGSAALLAQSPDALHYKLEIDLDFATQTLPATNASTFARRSHGLTTSPPAQTLSALDLTADTANSHPWFDQPIFHALVVSFCMIVGQELQNGFPQRCFAKEDHPLKAHLT